MRILRNIRLMTRTGTGGLVMLEAGYVPDVLVQVTSHVKRQSSIVKCQASSVRCTPWNGPMSTRVQSPDIRSCFLSSTLLTRLNAFWQHSTFTSIDISQISPGVNVHHHSTEDLRTEPIRTQPSALPEGSFVAQIFAATTRLQFL